MNDEQREPVVWADEASPFTGAQVKALLVENEKLRTVAKAAGEYLDARCWDEDEDVIEEAGEALANAMNAWKGIKRCSLI